MSTLTVQAPKIPEPPSPSDTIDFLAYHGLVAIQPEIRSSDWYNASQDPFRYYLTRRLGLTNPLYVSDALSHGSWFHVAAELDDFRGTSPSITSAFEDVLETRLTEIRSFKGTGLSATAIDNLLVDEDRRAREALAWYTAASAIRFPWRGEHYTFRSFFRRRGLRDLGAEIRWSLPPNRDIPHPSSGIFDRLILSGEDLYLVDWKTSSEDPVDRSSRCPWEFQTQLYLEAAHRLLDSHDFRKAHSLPETVKLAGMYHVIVQKPTLKFGQNDRDFTETTRTLTRGPNAGQKKTEKKYHGQPKLSNYLNRIHSWYAESAKETPPVHVSLTHYPLPDDVTRQFRRRVDHLKRLATMNPDPYAYPSYPNTGPRATALDLFTVLPVESWPAAVADLQLIINHRSH